LAEAGRAERVEEREKGEVQAKKASGICKVFRGKDLLLISTNLTRTHSTCILPLELTVG
jgi:hypothetical protein